MIAHSAISFAKGSTTVKNYILKRDPTASDLQLSHKAMQSFEPSHEQGMRAGVQPVGPRWIERPNPVRLPPFRTLKKKILPASTFREIRLPNGSLNYEVDRTVSAQNAQEEQEIVNEVLRVFQPRYRQPGRIETYLPPDMTRVRPNRPNYMHHRYPEPRMYAPSFGPHAVQYELWRPNRPPAVWNPPVYPSRFHQQVQPGDYNNLSKWPTVPMPGYSNAPCEQSCCIPQPFSSNAAGCSWPNCTECCPSFPQPPGARYRAEGLRFPTHEPNGPGIRYGSRCSCGRCQEAAAKAFASQQFTRPVRFPQQVFSYGSEFNTWSKRIWRSNSGVSTTTTWPESSNKSSEQTRVICGGSYRPFGHAFKRQQEDGRPVSSSAFTAGNSWAHSGKIGRATMGKPTELSERVSA